MSALDRVTAAMLSVAARRWPADVRAEMLREWTAELHALAGRRGTALRYALSLACSPGPREGARPNWRESLPSAGVALRPLLALIAVGLLIGSVPDMDDVTHGISHAVRGSNSVRDTPVDVLVSAFTILVCAVLAGVLGDRLGRWLPLRAPWRAASAVAAPLVIAGAQIATAVSTWDDASRDRMSAPLATAVWGTLAALVGVIVVRLALAGRRGAAIAVAVAGSLVALETASVVRGLASAQEMGLSLVSAPLWLPLGVVRTYQSSALAFGGPIVGSVLTTSQWVLERVHWFAQTALAASVFAVRYGLRGARAVPLTAPVPREPDVAAARQPAAVAAAGLAVALWVVNLAVLAVKPPTSALDSSDYTYEVLILLQELREAAIVLLALALAWLLSDRGPVLVPTLALTGGLVAADCWLYRSDLPRPAVAAVATALGLGAAVAAWALSSTLRAHPPGPSTTRRVRIGISMVAAFCAPAMAVHAEPAGPPALLTGGVTAATLIGSAAFAVLAGACALGARQAPASRRLRLTVLAAPATILVMSLALTDLGSPWAMLLLVLAPCLPALLFIVARSGAGIGRARLAGRLTAAAAAGIPLAYVQFGFALGVGEPLMRAAGYEFPVDGFPMLPGAAIVGLGFAAVAANRLVPGANATVGTSEEPLPVPG